MHPDAYDAHIAELNAENAEEPEPRNPTPDEWAHAFAQERPFVVHRPTLTVGRVTRAFMSGEYKDAEGRALTAPVLELEDGNAFVAERFAFVVIEQHEALFHGTAQALLTSTLRSIMAFAAAQGMDMDVAVLLLRSMVGAQLRELGRSDPAVAAEEQGGAVG